MGQGLAWVLPNLHHWQLLDQRAVEAALNPKPAQVVIIPIYWNKRAEEKAAVLAAAERAARVLRRGGVSAALDASDERMPGAKFKHWRACPEDYFWQCPSALFLLHNSVIPVSA